MSGHSVAKLLRELELNVRAWENAVECGIIPDRYRHGALVRIKDGRDIISMFGRYTTPAAEGALREIVKKWPDSAAARTARAALASTETRFPLVTATPECPLSHDGLHHIDTSMEAGPHHCFHCNKNMRTGA